MDFFAVGDDGHITCSGKDCTGAQYSATSKNLWGVSRSGTIQEDGAPVIVAVGDDGIIVRLLAFNFWEGSKSHTTRSLRAVSFAPRTPIGWAVGDEGTVLKTTDGGRTWGAQSANTTRHMHAVYAVSESIVWIAGDEAEVHVTADGGATWTRWHWQDAPLGIPWDTPTKIFQNFQGITGGTDWMIAVGNNGGIIQYQRGSWSGGYLGHKNLRAVAGSPGLVIAVGDDGAMYSAAGNGNFTARVSGTSKSLSGILLHPPMGFGEATVPGRAVVVGDNGVVLTSVDGGATWSLSTHGSAHLHAVT